jgi:hypothetical protein
MFEYSVDSLAMRRPEIPRDLTLAALPEIIISRLAGFLVGE